MSFLYPSYLWALLGIFIPIAIHLWSKKEGKTIKIGSIKLLTEAESRQSHSINMSELWLLIMRIAIVMLVVFILANPLIKRENTNTPITYIIEASLLENRGVTAMIDSLQSQHPILLLQNDFPEVSEDAVDMAIEETPNYWQLAKDMEKLRTDSIVVFTSAFVKGLVGRRPSVTKNMDWIILDSAPSSSATIEAYAMNNKLELLKAMSNSKHLSYKKEVLSSSSPQLTINESKDSVVVKENGTSRHLLVKSRDTLDILLYFNDTFAREATYIEASLNAISIHVSQPINIRKTQDSTVSNLISYHKIIWLNDTPLQNTTASILEYRSNDLANSIIVNGESINKSYLTRRLNPESIIDDRLTEHLLSWLDLRPDLDKKVLSLDKRVVNKEELLPNYVIEEAKSAYIEILSISKWLWILLALVLLAERIIAKLRKQ